MLQNKSFHPMSFHVMQCLIVWLLNNSHSPLLYSIFIKFNLSKTGSVFVQFFDLHGVKLQVKPMLHCLMFTFLQ